MLLFNEVMEVEVAVIWLVTPEEVVVDNRPHEAIMGSNMLLIWVKMTSEDV